MKTIRVHPARAHGLHPRLFRELTRAFCIEFTPCDSIDQALSGPCLIFGTPQLDSDSSKIRASTHPWYWVQSTGSPDTPSPSDSRRPANAKLGTIPESSLRFEAFELRQDRLPEHRGLDPLDGFESAARTEQGIVWSWRQGNRLRQYRVALPPEELAEGHFLRDHLAPGRNLRLLPLIHFLRAMTDPEGFQFPSVLACMALDDPNLHWPSYGFVNFRKMAEHAREHGYHVAVATVPLDAWWTHKGAAQIFKEHSQHVSLMMHGNDHTYMELGRDQSQTSRLARMAQALRRVARFEQRTGLHVARVMEPPHGVCNHGFATALADLGFAAGLLTHDRVLECGLRAEWPADFGLRELDRVDPFCPMIARCRWSQDWTQTVPLCALLGQPITIATHHEDAVGNFENFATIAQRINTLGPVHWCGFSEFTQSLYKARIQGEAILVHPYTRTLRVKRPPGVRTLSIQAPLSVGGEWTVETRPRDGLALNAPANGSRGDTHVPFGDARELWVHALTAPRVDHRTHPVPTTGPWPVLRRFLSTSRDRTRPFIHSR